jgi:hypothetical protein
MQHTKALAGGDRFIRWPRQTLSQLSTALALISGLSLGGLALSLSLLQDRDFNPSGGYAVVFLGVIVCFFVAWAAGVAAVITRLLDFRLTARRVRDGPTAVPLTLFGTDASGYGYATWRLFWAMVVCFGIAVCGTAVVMSRIYLIRILEAATSS